MEAARAELTAEEWRPVVGYEGLYSVSSLGRVRSEERVVEVVASRSGFRGPHQRRVKERVLSASPNNDGHALVLLCVDGTKSVRYVHSLVLEAFIGPRPPGQCALHGPNGSSDNSLGNLRYGTYGENNGSDRYRDGTMTCGERHPRSRFTEQQVKEIRASGLDPARLALRYGVTTSAVRHIRSRRSWKHVTW
jgi:hypothetical protein